MKEKVTVVGAGYVGMSIAVLLSQHYEVVLLDVDHEKIDRVNAGKSTIQDKDIEYFLNHKELRISATANARLAYLDASFIIVATPTDYDPKADFFDTSLVDGVCKDALQINDDALIVIKSTLPIGHTANLRESLDTKRIIFSPEFLREGRALHDNLYPSRIIIGGSCDKSRAFSDVLIKCCQVADPDVLFMDSTEAEAVKLFANTYLAMRVAFFNELDSYAMSNNLRSESIIKGVCLDPRVGVGYNNPSFGYGGYCLPKDTKQLLASFGSVPQKMIKAIVDSNDTRAEFLASEIIKRSPKSVGIFRLVMKAGSDNFRSSAVESIVRHIQMANINVIVYEPEYKGDSFLNCKVIDDIDLFQKSSEIIVANRMSDDLRGIDNIIFSRDIFGDN